MANLAVAVRRLPPSIVWCVAFFTYLPAVAVIAATHPAHAVGIALLAVVAALVGSRTTVLGAVWVGLAGWPFYAGFVTHAAGQLGVQGPLDAVVAGLLVLFAVGASIACRPAARAVPNGRREHASRLDR